MNSSRRDSGQHQARHKRLERLLQLRSHPVIASVLDRSHLEHFIESSAMFCFIAQFDLIGLESAVSRIHERPDKVAFVNIDSIGGLAQDKSGVDYLARLGVDGIVTTRGSLISRGQEAGMLTVQKLFVTDRANIRRGVAAVKSARPDLLQLMPAAVLPIIADHEVMRIRPVITAGFVTDTEGVETALSYGALGVSASTQEIWNYTRS